ncbi:MAG: hypothetical protein ACXW1W_15965 [Methylococcaceae bacterium]
MQKNDKSPLPVNSGGSKPVKYILSAMRIIGIVILGAYSGMWAHRFLSQEPQGYNERATQTGKRQLENEASPQSKHVKKAHNKEPAKQKKERLPVIIADTMTSAYNEHTVADELKIFSVSDIIASFMGSPYLTLQGGVDELM